MSGEVEKCPILHVRPKFDVFTLVSHENTTVHIYSSKKALLLEIFFVVYSYMGVHVIEFV